VQPENEEDTDVEPATAASLEQKVEVRTALARRRQRKSAALVEAVSNREDLDEATTAALVVATARQRDEDESGAATETTSRQSDEEYAAEIAAPSASQMKDDESCHTSAVTGEAEWRNEKPGGAGGTVVAALGLAERNNLHRELEFVAATATGRHGAEVATSTRNKNLMEGAAAPEAREILVTEAITATAHQKESEGNEDTDAYAAMQQRFQEAAAIRRRYEEAGAAVWLQIEKEEAQKRDKVNQANACVREGGASQQWLNAVVTQGDSSYSQGSASQQWFDAVATEGGNARKQENGDAYESICSWCVFCRSVLAQNILNEYDLVKNS
jgi:hypothetical protein